MREKISQVVSGDISSAFVLSESLSKDKDNLRVKLRLMISIVRHHMQNSKSNPEYERIAAALTALTISDRLIFERNISAGHVLNYILAGLTGSHNTSSLTALDESVTMLANC